MARNVRWSEEEKGDLISTLHSVPYRLVPAKHAEAYPFRSRWAVNFRIHQLGLETQNGSGDLFEVHQIAEIFNRDVEAVRTWVKRKILKSKKINHTRFVTYAELCRFCKARPDQAIRASDEWYEYLTGEPKPRVWTTTELSKHLFVTQGAITNWCQRGHVKPFFSKRSSERLFDENSLKQLLEHPKLRESYGVLINKLLEEG